MAYKIEGACVPIEFMVMGPIENNVYLVGDDEVVLVDPTCHPEVIREAIGQRTVSAIVLTHYHWDHVGAANAMRSATGAPVIASAVDAEVITGERPLDRSHVDFEKCPVDQRVSEGDVVETGTMKWRVIETPGHTPGCICLFLDAQYGSDPTAAPVLISGDTLFNGTHGRTDFEDGDPAAMHESLKKLADLPEDTVVLPGHNAPTSIGRERAWLVRGTVGR